MTANTPKAALSTQLVPRYRTVLDIGFGALVALFVSCFISKSAIEIAFGVAIGAALTAIAFHDRSFFRREPLVICWLAPIGIGAVLALFNLEGGLPALAQFLKTFRFLLIPLAIVVLIRDDRRMMMLFAAALTSATIATLYGLSQEEQHVFGGFHGIMSFPGRNADLLAITILTCIVFLDDASFRARHPRVTLAVAIIIPVLTAGVVLSGIRGSWLGLGLGLAAFAVFFSRRWLLAIAGALALLGSGMVSDAIRNELGSIVDLTTNLSNNTRLDLWVSGFDFAQRQLLFGTGISGLADRFLEFFAAQPADYQEANQLARNYPDNFHNSYLQVLVEWGLLYFCVFIACGAILAFRVVRGLRTVAPDDAVFVRAFVVTSVGFLSAQFFHGSLYSYGAIIYFLVAAGAMRAVAKARVRGE